MPFKLLWESRDTDKKRKYSQAWSRDARAYIRGYHAGHAYFQSLKTRNRTVAAKRFAELQNEIIKGAEALEDNSVVNFAAAVKIYFGTSNPEELDPTGRVARIFDKFAERRLSAITQADLDALARELHPKAGPMTLNREVYTPFVAVYNAAASADKVIPRRWRRPKGAHKVKAVNPPTDLDIRALVAAATRAAGRSEWARARNKAAIYCYTLTGDRTGPIVKLVWKNISFASNTIYFAETKNGEPRTVLMAPALREALDELAKKPHAPGDRVFGWATRAGPSRMIARARAAAGLGPMRPHDIGRHAFGRRARQSLKLDRGELMAAGNWKSAAAAARYDHMDMGTLMERVRDVDTTDLTGPPTSNKCGNTE